MQKEKSYGNLKEMINDFGFQVEAGVDLILSQEPKDRVSKLDNKIDNKHDEQVIAEVGGLSGESRPMDTDGVGVVVNNNSVGSLSSVEIANKCKTLADLEAAIRSFDGCPLSKTAMKTVFADGNPDADIMLIGEAPGADEDRIGKPFVGRSGQLLDNMFKSIGLTRDKNLYITNVINWRPPGNRAPTQMEIDTCLPFLMRHIELVSPKLICMLGATALRAVMGKTDPISKVRGRFMDMNFDEKVLRFLGRKTEGNRSIQVVTMYHPSYLLRSPSKKSIALVDLLRIKKLIKI